MRRIARAVLMPVAIAWAGFALAEPPCTYHEEAIDSPQVAKDSLTLLNTDPAEGAELRRDMQVAIDVRFQIADFHPKTYYLVPMFPTAGFSSMTPGDPADIRMLEHASGQVHLCVPLREAYEYEGMIWPLSIGVMMLKTDGGPMRSFAASTRKVKFKSPDAPAARSMLPDEYYDALQHTSSYFDTRALLYKVCISRFPAMQPALTKSYRAWEARHRADMDLVSELQFARYTQMANGREDRAAMIDDATMTASRHAYDGLAQDRLKQECQMKLSEFSDPDDTTDIALGDELEILRRHSGKVVENKK